MQKQTVDADLEHFVRTVTPTRCEEAILLLRRFARARSSDLAFLLPHDLVNVNNAAFQGISEWDDFAGHCASCGRCDGR